MNPLCNNCKVTMTRGHDEYYCPKCGLVIDNHKLIPSYEEGHGPFVPAWRANLPQTRPAEKWVGGRCYIRGMRRC